MAYDVELADRLREVLVPEPDLTEKRMFGGLAFLVAGRMAVAATREGLMVRVDPADTPTLLADRRARPFVMRGRELDGWLRVDVGNLDDTQLGRWVEHGVRFARSLPPR